MGVILWTRHLKNGPKTKQKIHRWRKVKNMLYIDGKEFTTYFKGKECIENFGFVGTILFSAFSENLEMDLTPKIYIHFWEALAIYLSWNVNSKKADVSNIDFASLLARVKCENKHSKYNITPENGAKQLTYDGEMASRFYLDLAVLGYYKRIKKRIEI